MYLKSIKLAGFKSFVDATTFPIKSYMNAIVGPNGCGKSNVVDAIRWVIGESSAKQLRGQSMSDVIFNGTNARKPVGKAAVELIFDNTDGKLVGEFAKFTELAIRREVTRDGQSNYYLNGTSCRRKDILDIFLGTGLGPRSYAIIEQGMVSRLIEAKPEDLRVYLEEAAGISKYKERRRETENRMRHTEENLERVNDVCDELNKQLNHLKRQANAAERYNVLKEEERLLNAQFKTLQWRDLAQQLQAKEQLLLQETTQQEEQLSLQRQLETAIEKARQDQTEAMDAQNIVQKSYYGLGAEIARLEQRIKSMQEQAQQWQSELSETDAMWQELNDSSLEYQDQIQELEKAVVGLIPELDNTRQQKEVAHQALVDAEAKMNHWQDQWDNFQRECSQASQQHEVNKTKIDHIKQQLNNSANRKTSLQANYDNLQLGDLESAISPLSLAVNQFEQELADIKTAMEQLSQRINQQRQRNSENNAKLQQTRSQLQTMKGRHASLDALQQSALGGKDSEAKTWLNKHQLTQRPRLAQELQVEAGWETAVETVLGNHFDAVCVDQIDSFIDELKDWKKGHITLIETIANVSGDGVKANTLASKLTKASASIAWLQGIYVAANVDEATRMRTNLKADESVITSDGIWMGKNWIRVSKSTSAESGVLLREQELKQLQADMVELSARIEEEELELREGEAELRELERERDEKHQASQALSRELTKTQSELSVKQTRLAEARAQQQRLQNELIECDAQADQLKTQLLELENSWQQLLTTKDEQSLRNEELLEQRNQLRTQLEAARNDALHQRQQVDQLAVQLAANENQLALLKQTVVHDERRLAQLSDKRESLTKNLSEKGGPIEELNAQLQEELSKHLVIEGELNAAQAKLEEYTQLLKELESQRGDISAALTEIQSRLEQIRMDRQSKLVMQETIKEQITERNCVLEEVLQALPEDARADLYQDKIAQVVQKIERLGPINLAAIDEFKTVNERKEYLDQQQKDLLEALDLLKNAIQKIDKETRTKFKETFDFANNAFQELFPRIFGGGKAYLELEENDLLTAGVVVKAQPPGKRNATVHMLSGGEKALVAISLVFAMFQLNPAPFCVLDEVDAPLDDINVGRYCQLIKEMSAYTQFIIISHNKVTIGTADHLLGVTMQEPGVSRMVAVDMKEAIEMVA